MSEPPQDPSTGPSPSVGAPPAGPGQATGTGQATGSGHAADEVVDPTEQPAAGGTDGGEPAQGEGAPDSH